jgi:hypothetical protein
MLLTLIFLSLFFTFCVAIFFEKRTGLSPNSSKYIIESYSNYPGSMRSLVFILVFIKGRTYFSFANIMDEGEYGYSQYALESIVCKVVTGQNSCMCLFLVLIIVMLFLFFCVLL